ncbi:type III secretion system gatekeeper subunit SctW [Chitinimonas lacunae]|uniref:Type III secretion system gatekeeper subunit SctW n=1 Tax=Chitinimonas lacunae TaxID=1963018 RepID=A0ABV8MT67_9NEIS
MIRIDSNGLGSLGSQSNQSAQTATQNGSWRGEALTLKNDANSILTDAAEEITFAHAERADAKRLQERKLEARRGPELLTLEQIAAYLHDMHGQIPEKLVELAKQMLARGAKPDQLAQALPDPAERFLALQYAARQGEKDGASAEQLDAIHEALAELEAEHGDRIHAGLNAAAAGRELGNPAAGARLRGAYQDMVLGQASLAATVKALLERFGSAEFARAVPLLMKALGDDLAAARPSREPQRLQAILDDLYQIEVAVTVLEHCQSLAATLAQRHGCKQVDAQVLMQELIQLSSERWISASRFTALTDRFGVHEPTAQVALLFGLKLAAKDLPIKIFADQDSRQALLNAVQEALDQAIEREEEA